MARPLYTPLEQYGGDGGHTDDRTDIYALGATLYHLLTDFPPPDAKARFLNPRALQPPRALNLHVSHHASEAIMWAMEMHPDDRPESITQFRQVLLGKENRPGRRDKLTGEDTLATALKSNRLPALIALSLFILAIILTIL